MELIVEKNIALKPYNTMGLQATAAYFCHWQNMQQLPAIIKESFRQPETIWLGGGSNTLFLRDIQGLVVHIATRGIDILAEDGHNIYVRVAAGEVWHDFVCHAISQGWYGIENMALIPGTVGAAPVQNIGAYGVEVQEVIDCVHVADTQTGERFILSHQECRFSYRHSIFKQQANWLIYAVDFRLKKLFEANLHYAPLAQVFSGSLKGINAQTVFEAVCAIRRKKLPDWTKQGNCGSFFHNPCLSFEKATLFLKKHPHAVHHRLPNGSIKVAAAWLIDKANLKGFAIGDAMVHPKQPLVLVNCGHACAEDFIKLSQKIQHTIYTKFDIDLKIEPHLVE